MSSTVRSLGGRASWNVADQMLSALSNIALSVVVANTLDANAFGAFSVAFLVFGIAVGVQRAVVGQPLQINHSGEAPHAFRQVVSRGLGVAVALGALFGTGAAVAGVLLGGLLADALFALAVTLPFLLLQDACRMAMFAARNPRQATVIDLVWTVSLFAVLAGLLWAQLGSLHGFTLAWGATAGLSAVVGCSLLGVRPALRRIGGWLPPRRRLTGYLVSEYLLGLGASQTAMLMAGAIAGTREVGALRAAQVVLGPLGIVGAAAFAFAVPELSRRKELRPRRRAYFGLALSGVMATLAAVYLVVLLLVPDSWGTAVFRDTWSGARAVLLPMGLVALAASLGSGPGVVLYSLGRVNLTFRLNSIKAPLLLVTVWIGTHAAGAGGAAVALALCEALLLPAWFWMAYRALRGKDEAPRAKRGPAESRKERTSSGR